MLHVVFFLRMHIKVYTVKTCAPDMRRLIGLDSGQQMRGPPVNIKSDYNHEFILEWELCLLEILVSKCRDQLTANMISHFFVISEQVTM